MGRGQISDFTVEKSVKLIVKVNVSLIVYDDKNGILPLWMFLQNFHNPDVSMQKASYQSQYRNMMKYTWPTILKIV